MRQLRIRLRGLLASLRDESGQAATEYVMTTTLLLVGGLGVAVTWPYTTWLFNGLQKYVDFFFFCLDLAVG